MNNEIALVGPTSVIEMPSDAGKILQLPTRITWDVRAPEPFFQDEFQQSDELTGTLLKAGFMYACWTDVIGQPACMGFGEKCPDHPETSAPGIALVLDTEQFGGVYMTCFGLLHKWAIGLVRQSEQSGGSFHAKGQKAIRTRFGTMFIPGFQK